jgi:hypothetical protein
VDLGRNAAGVISQNDLLNQIKASKIFSRNSLLRHCALTAGKGTACEFGVFTGGSLKVIRNYRKPPVYGFDSWTGLPEAWEFGSNKHEQGHFTCDKPKDLASGTYLVDGFFENSLPVWLETHQEPIKLIHLDADLYSSTKTVLTLLNDRIENGTILIFDELLNLDGSYSNWQDGEWQALNEWLKDFNREVECIARTESQQAAFIVRN